MNSRLCCRLGWGGGSECFSSLLDLVGIGTCVYSGNGLFILIWFVSSVVDKQLIQYTALPLLAFLDGNPSSVVESANEAPETISSVDKPLEVDELLESSLDPQPTQSKLVRLEPLTEAEASEATLFYLCELAPVPMDTDMPLMN